MLWSWAISAANDYKFKFETVCNMTSFPPSVWFMVDIHYKKICNIPGFFVIKPSWDWDLVNYAQPGRVWYVTSRLGTGRSLTFFTVSNPLTREYRADLAWGKFFNQSLPSFSRIYLSNIVPMCSWSDKLFLESNVCSQKRWIFLLAYTSHSGGG